MSDFWLGVAAGPLLWAALFALLYSLYRGWLVLVSWFFGYTAPGHWLLSFRVEGYLRSPDPALQERLYAIAKRFLSRPQAIRSKRLRRKLQEVVDRKAL